MRIFIAIDLPGSIRRELERWQNLFRSALSLAPASANEIRWMRPEGIHLTLRFLGEVSAAGVDLLVERLQRLGTFKPFPVEVKGFGFFPDARRPRVFWAGVTVPPELTALATGIETTVAGLDFGKELRLYKPHLTLARFKSVSPQPVLEAMSKQEGNLSLGRFRVSEFYIFESKLTAGTAPQYHKLARLPMRQ